MSVSLTFPDTTYTSANKPATATLKTDLAAIETDLNAALKGDGSVNITNNISSTGVPSDKNHLATMGAIYPIGSVYIAVVATDPSALLGFGTWARIAEGRMLVGYDTTDEDFNTVEAEGGSKTHTNTEAEMFAHSHTADGNLTAASNGSHNHSPTGGDIIHTQGTGYSHHTQDTPTGHISHVFNSMATLGISTDGAHTHDITGSTSSKGSTNAYNIMNPYFITYMWKRTA